MHWLWSSSLLKAQAMSSYWELTVLNGRVYKIRRKDSLCCTDFYNWKGKHQAGWENNKNTCAHGHMNLKIGLHWQQIPVDTGKGGLVESSGGSQGKVQARLGSQLDLAPSSLKHKLSYLIPALHWSNALWGEPVRWKRLSVKEGFGGEGGNGRGGFFRLETGLCFLLSCMYSVTIIVPQALNSGRLSEHSSAA